jgi:3',5'-cyclic AMP phosphodiesterase CpdA
MHNFLARFLRPLASYRRYITPDLEPVYQDEEIVAAGVNTARSLTVKGGRINRAQVAGIHDRLCALDGRLTKIIVTHHPFELPEGYHGGWLVGRAHMAMQALAACGADVLLAGHLHLTFTGHTAARYRIEGHSALVVQAGTATSTRGRGELNSFNVLRIEHPLIRVEQFAWDATRRVFARWRSEHFRQSPEGWAPE